MARPATKTKPRQDDVEFFDVEQRTTEWHELRRGIPTASKFSIIMASGVDGEDSKTREKLMNVMAGEILTEEPAESFVNDAMARGVEMEPEARDYYKRTTFAELTSVGFVRRTIHRPLGEPLVVGCSPDSLVESDGALEIKTMRPDLMIPIIKKGPAGLPAQHRAQCQGTLWVTGRLWCDLQIFYRGMPYGPRFRMERDEQYIARVRDAVEVFVYELHKLVQDIRSRGPR